MSVFRSYDTPYGGSESAICQEPLARLVQSLTSFPETSPGKLVEHCTVKTFDKTVVRDAQSFVRRCSMLFDARCGEMND